VRAQSFGHVGITVRDFNTFVKFLGGVRLPARRRGRHPARASEGVLRRRRADAVVPWNRIGQTHFSLNGRNTPKWHDHLVSQGVEIVSKPERSPRGHTFFFARDCDGNLIELMDLGYKHYALD